MPVADVVGLATACAGAPLGMTLVPVSRAGRSRTVRAASSDRAQERLRQHGASVLATAELLTILLGHGQTDAAARTGAEAVWAACDGQLGRLVGMPLAHLGHLPQVGSARAVTLMAAVELGRRVVTDERAPEQPMRGPSDVAAFCAPRLQDAPVEEFHVLILNAQNRLVKDVLVTRGLLDSSLVHPREVFREAIAERAAAVLLVHNHPSGDPTPSAEDRDVTERLVAAGRMLDIPVRDHIIIGHGRYASFAESGLL